MMTIYKYPLRTTDTQTVQMPVGAEILTVQAQGEGPCIWALVDPDAALSARIFRTFGTGHPVPPEVETMPYVGTFQLHGGSLVFHVFEAECHAQ